MFQSLKSIVYRVSDLQQAKQWYREILNAEPAMDSPFIVSFRIGDSKLTLTQHPNPVSNSDTVVAYWGVDDVDSAYRRLLQLGATPHSEINTLFGTRMASVIDPFGNVLGLTGTTQDAKQRSVEQQPSETAMAVATLRALAASDEREEIRGADYLAEIFLTEESKKILKDLNIREWVLKNQIPPGLYEYLIARTAWFDHLVARALRENIPQIVFLGAGYDSRSYRFKDLIRETRIFELDIHTTQQRKKELLHQANVPIPEQVVFVTINFNTDTLQEVLTKAGFDKNQKTLFIWEGVTFYLPAGVVDDTLSFVKSNSPVGSGICFDYTDANAVEKLREDRRSTNPGEPIQFGIEEGKIESFLAERGYQIIDHLTATDMERKYLTLRDGSLVGNAPARYCFVYASV
jgi:methyltransferase (TIGR00027 family)